MSDTNQSQQPSLVAGHAQYVKGQAEVSLPMLQPLNPSSSPFATVH